jgi:hypothetical protein
LPAFSNPFSKHCLFTLPSNCNRKETLILLKKFWKKFVLVLKLSIVEEILNILDYSNTTEYPVAIEFYEAGGPVASGYKYLTQVKVFSKAEKIFLSYKEVRDFVSPKPRLVVSNEKELSLDIYKEILVDLINHQVTSLNHNFISDVSSDTKPNFFSFTLGDIINVRFDYLLSHKDTPEFEPYEDIIQSMKNLLFSNLR